jgi:quinol monooxygenase YgiN
MSHFFLEALEHIHIDKVSEYLEISRITDQKVRETEPGMLIHAQTLVETSAEKHVYRWLEVYRSYEDLEAHLKNPCVEEHIAKLNNGFLCAPLDVTFYCDWDDDQKKPWLSIEGLKLQFAELVNGYYI